MNVLHFGQHVSYLVCHSLRGDDLWKVLWQDSHFVEEQKDGNQCETYHNQVHIESNLFHVHGKGIRLRLKGFWSQYVFTSSARSQQNTCINNL